MSRALIGFAKSQSTPPKKRNQSLEKKNAHTSIFVPWFLITLPWLWKMQLERDALFAGVTET
jgi:hypothetical protein